MYDDKTNTKTSSRTVAERVESFYESAKKLEQLSYGGDQQKNTSTGSGAAQTSRKVGTGT